ncbi:MAG: DegT/DnrJ/EryC1/StrS family aminotransferase, partial [Bryobacteraceae bacterium]
MQVPFLDLGGQLRPIRDEIMDAIARVVDSQKLILGDEVRCVEERLAGYCGARHAIGCASGSDALLLALKALGIGEGDEVLTVPFTFFATAGAISLAGARPVFADVKPETFNLDPRSAAAALERHPKIKAMIPVHLFGGCADIDALKEISDVPIIEDAAQSIGAEYKGRRAGSLGSIGCFSFYPTKNLGAFGDGGMCTTNDDTLSEKLRALRIHGRTGAYFHESVGTASRLDALQAAVLAVKLNYLDAWTSARARNASLYCKLFTDRGVPVILPRAAAWQTRHVFHQYVIRCERRDELQKFLGSNCVGCEVYYPLALHEQPCFSSLGYKRGDFPVGEQLAATVLALPIHSDLAPEQ